MSIASKAKQAKNDEKTADGDKSQISVSVVRGHPPLFILIHLLGRDWMRSELTSVYARPTRRRMQSHVRDCVWTRRFCRVMMISMQMCHSDQNADGRRWTGKTPKRTAASGHPSFSSHLSSLTSSFFRHCIHRLYTSIIRYQTREASDTRSVRHEKRQTREASDTRSVRLEKRRAETVSRGKGRTVSVNEPESMGHLSRSLFTPACDYHKESLLATHLP